MGESIVEEWLRSLNLVHYTQAFLDNGYDDLEVCKQIGDPDLDAIGVEKPSDREEILNAVKILREQGGTAVYFTLENPDYVDTTGLYRDYYVTEREGEEEEGGATPGPSRGDGYSEGKKALLTYPKLQLTAIVRDKLAEDNVTLTEMPYTAEEGGLDKEKISELAEKYAADLKTHVKDVTESLEEFYRIVTAPEEQSPEREDGRESPTKNVYGLFSIYGQSSRSVPPPLPSRPPPSSTYADPVELEPSIRTSPVKSPRHGSTHGSGNLDNTSAGSETSLPTEPSTASEGASDGAERGDTSSPRRTSTMGAGISRFFKIRKSGRKYTYAPQPGDPSASEITMSNEELANILIRVKEGTMNTDDAVRAVKRYEQDKGRISEVPTEEQVHTSMLCSPSPKAATLPRAPGEGLPAGGSSPHDSPARGKKSNSSPIHRFKVFLTRGKGKQSNGREMKAREDPGAGNLFEGEPSPAVSKKQGWFSSPGRKGSSPNIGHHSPSKDKKKTLTLSTPFQSPFSRRKSKDSPKHSLHGDVIPGRKGSDTGSTTSSSGIPSPRTAPTGVNPSLSHPLIGDKTPEIVRSISVGSKIPSPSHGAGSGRRCESPDAITKRPLPQLPTSALVKANTFKTTDDYEPSFYQITADVHSQSDEKESARESRIDKHSGSRENVEKMNKKNGARCPPRKSDHVEEGDNQSGRSPKRHTPPSHTPPDSHSPKRQHISDLQQIDAIERTHIDLPHKPVIDSKTRLDSRFSGKSSRESPDPGIEVSPTGTLDSEGMSKCGSSSTMSIGSEASPTMGRQKEKIREKSRLPRPRSNSFSTGDEYVSSDLEEDRTSVRSTRICVGDRQNRQDDVRIRKGSERKGSDTVDKTGTGSSMESVTGEKAFSSQPVNSDSSHSSMSIEEEGTQKGEIIGLARAITDHTPSPYDREALTFKKGDIVQVLDKCESGLWVGIINNKVGSFKFINVEMLPDAPEKPVKKPKSVVRRSYRRPKPKTVEELLGRIGLQHLFAKFHLNGFETLELFSNVEESDLDQLEILDQEERTKIITAASLLCEDTTVSPGRTVAGADGSGAASHRSPSLTNGERDRADGQEQGASQACDIHSCDLQCDESCDDITSKEHYLSLAPDDQEILSIGQNGVITIACLGDGTVYETPHITKSTSSELDKRDLYHSTSGDSISSKHSMDSSQSGKRDSDKSSCRSRHSREFSDSSERSFSPRRSQVPTLGGSPCRSPTGKGTPKRHRPKVPERTVSLSLEGTAGPSTPTHLRDASTQHGGKIAGKFSTFSPRRNVYTSDGQLVSVSPIASPKIKTAHVRQLSSRVGGTSLVTFAPEISAPQSHSRSRLPRSTGSSPTHEGMRGLSPSQLRARRRSRPLSASLEVWVASRLEAERIDLTDPPYTDKHGNCGIPGALVQRYAEETQRDIFEIAQALEEWRLRELQNRGKQGIVNESLGDACLMSTTTESSPVSLPDFLTSIGLPMYLQSLVCNDYRTLDDLNQATEESLQHCGISDISHIRRLLGALEPLQGQQGQGVRGQIHTPTHRSQRVSKVSEVVDRV